MAVDRAIRFVGTVNDFSKVDCELDGDLLTLTHDVNGLEKHQLVLSDTQFEEIIEAYYKAKEQRDAGNKN